MAAWTAEETAYLKKNSGRMTFHAIGLTLGRTANACRFKAAELGCSPSKAVADPVPTSNRSLPQIIANQIEEFRRKEDHHRAKQKGVRIELPDDGPFGVLLMGDPHFDDPGADAGELLYHLRLVRETDGLYAANVGDLTNNWVGRLKSIYEHQTTTGDEATALIRYLIEEHDWLFVILGNHDKWGPVASLVCDQAKVTKASHGAKFHVWAGDACLKIDARHDHKGRSQFISSFAQLKQMFRGNDSHVIVAGHIHVGSSATVRNGVADKIGHCIRLGAYKKYDEFAESLHLDNDDLGPACLVVCDTRLTEEHVGFVKPFWDVDAGVEYLKFLRGQWEAAKEEVA